MLGFGDVFDGWCGCESAVDGLVCWDDVDKVEAEVMHATCVQGERAWQKVLEVSRGRAVLLST